MKSKIQKPKGTRDFFGEELQKFNYLSSVIIEELKLNGFLEIKTPIYEYEEVFAKNDDCEILGANKEFFYLSNRDQESVNKYVLRSENTASVARAIVENNLLNIYPSPLKYYYSGPFFRYDRPQRGRYRQFTQIGFEKINTTSILEDIDNIRIAERIFKKLNLKLKLHVNYLGKKHTKEKWNVYLKDYFEKYRNELSPKSQKRISKNPMRILDEIEDSNKECVLRVLTIDNFLETEEKLEMDKCFKFLLDLNIDYVWDKYLVRGIDYYTGLVYEWKDIDSGLSIAAGGRYDDLFSRFHDKSIPSTGLAIGVDRLFNISNINIPKPSSKIFYLSLLTDPDRSIFDFLNSMQDLGAIVVCNFETKDLKKHFKMAEKHMISNLLIYGDQEKSESKITLKTSTSQEKIDILNVRKINYLI